MYYEEEESITNRGMHILYGELFKVHVLGLSVIIIINREYLCMKTSQYLRQKTS